MAPCVTAEPLKNASLGAAGPGASHPASQTGACSHLPGCSQPFPGGFHPRSPWPGGSRGPSPGCRRSAAAAGARGARRGLGAPALAGCGCTLDPWPWSAAAEPGAAPGLQLGQGSLCRCRASLRLSCSVLRAPLPGSQSGGSGMVCLR